MGMMERMNLINMTLPTRFNQEETQLLIKDFNLSIIGSQLEDFGVELKIDMPKYLKASH